MEDIKSTASNIIALRNLNLRLAIDDFGTGYSSLLYLKRFPVAVLKIDRSFVDGLGLNPEDDVIATSIISLARALELEVVAEGVETQIQLDLIRKLGSDYGQGNLLGQPMTIGETERSFISQRRPHTPVVTTP